MNFLVLKKLLPLIGLALFVFIIFNIGIEEILSTVASANLFFLLLATLFIFPVMLLQAVKWGYLLRKQGIKEDFFWLVKTNLIGVFYGMVTPSKIGSFIRISYLKKKRKISLKESSLSVVFDRFFDLAGAGLLALLGILLVFRNLNAMFLGVVLASLVLLSLVVIFLNNPLKRRVLWFVFGLVFPSNLEKRKETFEFFFSYLSRKKEFLFPLFLSSVTWLVMCFQAFLVALAFGISVPVIEFIFLLMISVVVSSLPITVADLGVREATLIYLFLPYGVAASSVVSMSLTSYLLLVGLEALLGFSASITQKL